MEFSSLKVPTGECISPTMALKRCIEEELAKFKADGSSAIDGRLFVPRHSDKQEYVLGSPQEESPKRAEALAILKDKHQHKKKRKLILTPEESEPHIEEKRRQQQLLRDEAAATDTIQRETARRQHTVEHYSLRSSPIIATTSETTTGRVKLKTKRLESTSNQQVTYLRRRNGILKKAKELFILCDIDIALLMFSPIGKPTLFRRERSNIEEVITKSAQLTPQERTKSSLESLEAPKKTFKKLDHDVNIQDFLGSRCFEFEFLFIARIPMNFFDISYLNCYGQELSNQLRMMRAQLTEAHKRLRCNFEAHIC
ncbi:uncharacterized protein LOC114300148 [Camellia sinensis]|uniref:uncharacterized protein LOC114300148 n=1 Tax=Camellia sinensis TaxID=4442 RepID=UPI001035D2CC|nr:uncharacterized protein LOC114300148 [Camellia sinensis]